MYEIKLVDGSTSKVDGDKLAIEDFYIKIFDIKLDPTTGKLSEEWELVFYSPVDSIICIQKI